MIRKPSFYRIDEQVFFTMGGLSLLALIVLAFRFSSKEECAPVTILAKDTVVVGETAVIKAETLGGKNYSWSFGDNGNKDEITNATTHVYETPGRYTISVLINSACENTRQIVVIPAVVVENTSMLPVIEAPDTALVGQRITVTDLSAGSTSWEWNFGETSINTVDDKEQVASYTYKTEGKKYIRVKVNGRPDLVRSKEVYVKDPEAEKKKQKKENTPKVNPVAPIVILPEKPVVDPIKPGVPEPEPAKQKAPALGKTKLQEMIANIPGGITSLEDFDAYTCGNHNIKVLYDKREMTLSAFYAEVRKMKRKKIKKVDALKIKVDEETNCVIQIAVDIDTRWITL